MKNQWFMSGAARGLSALGILILIGSAARAAPDPTNLRINEILTANKNTPPADAENQYEDMLEIYNPSEDDISLKNLIITDTVTKDSLGNLHPAGSPYKFLFGSVLSKRTILVYCDNNVGTGGSGEPHASFKLNQQGGLVALFAPNDVLIDMVAIPRLATGTSYGRVPDGTGSFCHLAVPTFKKCSILTGGCGSPAPNSPCANIPPEINLHAHNSIVDAGSANPAPGAAVPLVAEVWDEKVNTDSVHDVEILYRVDGGDEHVVNMTLDPVATALIMVKDFANDPTGATLTQDKNRSNWKGEIPGQAQGAKVTFTLKVIDTEGASGADPKVVCSGTVTTDCKTPYRYQVGYNYTGSLVLNEIAAWNTSYFDTTDSTPKTDDFIEIYSDSDVTLDGYFLSTNPFQPDEWKFPTGSAIKAGQHLIVWCDGDFGKIGIGPFHTSFKLDKAGAVIYIFDKDANGMGMIDGYKYPPAKENTSFSRCPDAVRTSPFVEELGQSPTKPSGCSTPQGQFIRGDSDDTGALDITDAYVILAYMFLAGPPPRCMDQIDSDDNGVIDLNDPLYVLNFLFQDGPAPLAPYPAKGADTTTSTLPPCTTP